MLSLRFGKTARIFAVAAFASAALLSFAVPARADDTATARAAAMTAKRAPQSFAPTGTSSILGSTPSSREATGYANGFLYLPGPQPELNLGGRVPVGKSHVYVPYYGNVGGDPTHPTWQGAAGLAYGFRTWDISVVNGGFGSVQSAVPGAEAPKANPSLSLSIRF
jgi:hypothetical protein